ncbi:MAG: DUF402 domain-containing protein [Pyrinomonadaceae bacterium]
MAEALPDQRITINSRKYDGSIRRTWQCGLIEQTGPQYLFLGIFDQDVIHSDLGTLSRGTLSYEYYWLDRWFNIFRFHEPDGTFRNFYCNISMPPVFKNGVLDYVDLDLDVLVWPGWRFEILDEAEYAENAQKFDYPATVRDSSASALSKLLKLIENRKLPGSAELF